MESCLSIPLFWINVHDNRQIDVGADWVRLSWAKGLPVYDHKQHGVRRSFASPEMPDLLRERGDFIELVGVVSGERGIDPVLMERDAESCVGCGPAGAGACFELKGGSSRSKGFGIIRSFSGDIDIQVEPSEDIDLKIGGNPDKPAQVDS